MKRTFQTLLVLVAVLTASTAWSRNVTADEALDAAVHYMQHNTNLERLDASYYTLAYQWNNDELQIPSMYLFKAESNGWIIMTATTAIKPVVAFSDDSDVDPSDMPEQMAWWLDQYNEVVCGVQKLDQGRGLPDQEQWTALTNHSIKGNTKDDRIILTRVRWGQGSNDGKLYNSYCPQVNGVYTVVGCVATAMAQLCWYYKFPKQAIGYTGYSTQSQHIFLQQRLQDSAVFDYSVMPEKLTNASSDEAKAQVARLSYSLGVAAHMDYNTTAAGGSGANSMTAVNAMHNCFKYTQGSFVSRGYVSESSYMKQIRDELTQSHVVYMHGSSPGSDGNDAGGHAWLCTGYRESDEDQYYMNWGWNGGGNAWFDLGNNNMTIPNYGYNFYATQGYVKGMVPPADSLLAIPQVDLATEVGSAYPNPATLSVQIPYQTTASADMMVYSVDGRRVYTQRVAAGEGEVRLDVSAMPAGIYIYRLGSAYGKFIVK